ncbi:hypothetical protein B0H63DRAFT_452480 [Podospora didyma]|uniref:Uncharacterized protein n=1 Tax=Podospora didyma TaxID=330526 RepID=A0AAE0KEU9_9PEZI|nr:hypothetical protein B0H63DRAFT_452480 [Podospora didyma]
MSPPPTPWCRGESTTSVCELLDGHIAAIVIAAICTASAALTYTKVLADSMRTLGDQKRGQRVYRDMFSNGMWWRHITAGSVGRIASTLSCNYSLPMNQKGGGGVFDNTHGGAFGLVCIMYK